MKVQVNATFQVNDYLNELIQEKVGKLTQYANTITNAEMYLKIGENRHRHAEEQIVELRIDIPGHTFFAEERSDVFEKAVAAATDKVKRQMRKHKEQVAGH
ncbi:ribosome hibernation-promoting factor, HPF/YfiA family [Phaeodactylibacter luteus]|uniref:Ribosome-associated translation inhibitor RaiA n=1 Tax=Phaeodactylibacter luteus TaxID=1564516 RepID=A0A5C6RM33_9BACT|nr:ribosome-associated translation inhibitor RaiA [Phaeodactylibacter luteus]TXB63396.1 ribosome-associated translation inhibitor RaiA [Phaeodactylibacter luteus]